jgi:predicted permease
MKAASHSYVDLGVFAGPLEEMAFPDAGAPQIINGARVSANFLSILETTPARGRSFSREEEKTGAPPVVMLSNEFWQREFAADPTIVGKIVTLAGARYIIIGVLPAGFQFPVAGIDVWLTKPSELSTISIQSRPISPTLTVFGRLKTGVDIAQANAERAVLKEQYAKAHPGMLDGKPGSPETLLSLKDEIVSDVRPKLWILFGALGLVLLIVCANIGSLQLAHAMSRTREFAVRTAIGADRGRIVRHLLTENMLLAFISGALGITLAAVILNTIQSATFVDLPRTTELQIDSQVLLFAFALSAITGFLFSVAPLFIVWRKDLAGILRGSEPAKASRKKLLIVGLSSRSLLVAAQITLSVALLIGATLLMQSLARLYRVDPGFQPNNLLTAHIALPVALYNSDEKQAAFYQQLVERVDALPGVLSSAMSLTLPMSGWAGVPVQRASDPQLPLNKRPISIFQTITPRYFHTMKITLQRGREFTAHDDLNASPVAIINESLARRLWPQYPNGADPVGQYLLMGMNYPPKQIVGIAADVHQLGKDQDPPLGLYVPNTQALIPSASLIVRTSRDPQLLASAVQREILSIDPEEAVSDVKTMNEIVEASEGQLVLMMRLLGGFAVAATLLALIGIYGVVSYSVVQRTKEIGIRQALGARRSDVLALVITEGLSFSAVGIALGICTALALTRVLKSLLFQVSTTDTASYVAVCMLFLCIALMACYVPARRAAKIDPMVALRYE